MTTPTSCDVLVVGAGPTGLVAANLLARSGLRVRIVEKRTESSRESRAFAVQARSLELFQAIGLAEAMIARGVVARSVNIHVRGRFAGGLNFTKAKTGDTPFPFILMIPQSETETILADDLERLGVPIERGVECLAISIDDASVEAQLQGRHGDVERVRCAYVVGADGSRSLVRQAAGIGWDGDSLPQRFLLADCRVEWPFDHDNFRVFLNGPLIGLFLPLKGEACSRVMATDLSAGFGVEDASVPAPLDLDEMRRGLAAAFNVPVTLSDPVWVTRYRAHHRFVDTYALGRAFVAGDAAHIHSPAGGQGMNTGMQDAANLAWKIAAVVRGADPALLDTYDAERRPVGDAVVKRTGRLFAATAGQAGFKARLRDRLVSVLLPILSRASGFQHKAFQNVSQRAIAYPADGRLVRDHRGDIAGPHPGERAPDARIPGGPNLFERVAGYRFTLVALSLDAAGSDDERDLRASLSELTMLDGRATLLVLDAVQDGSELAKRYGLTPTSRRKLFVLRPDGYVGWCQSGWDGQALSVWVTDLLGARPAPAGQKAIAELSMAGGR